MAPHVSVVIPVFNQARYVAEAIESVLAQTYPSVETIVVDDGSTDGTSDIAMGYGPRIAYLRQDNAGAAAALNRGIQMASGDLIGWLSSDDVYLPAKLQRQVDVLNRLPEVNAVYTDFLLIDAGGEVIKTVRSPYFADRNEFIRKMILDNFVNGSSILVRRAALLEAGGFDPQMTYHADANMWLRMLKRGAFAHIPEILLKYRTHAGAASRNVAGMHMYRYIYFDKIWETFAVEDILADTQNKETFLTAALISNGLFDRAWRRLMTGRGTPGLFVKLAAAWSAGFLRRQLAGRRPSRWSQRT